MATVTSLHKKVISNSWFCVKILVLAMLLVVGPNLDAGNAAASQSLAKSGVRTSGVVAEVEQTVPMDVLNTKMRAPSFVGYGAYFDASSSHIFSALGVSPYGGNDSSLWDWSFCSTLDSLECAPGDGKWLSAWSILGTCQSEQDLGCIEGVNISVNGSEAQPLVKVEALGSETVFTENAEMGIPRASSPARWQAPDGTQYVLTSRVVRNFLSSNNVWKSLSTSFQLQIERVSTTAVLAQSAPYIGPSLYHEGKHMIFGGGLSLTPLMFEPKTVFTSKVRLPNVVKGWFQARFKDGIVGSKALSRGNTSYDISGEVAPVYIAGGAVAASALPSDFFTKLYPTLNIGFGGVLGPIDPGQGTRSLEEYKAWSPYFADTALTTSYQWNVRSTDWPAGNTCFDSLTGVTGLLATNAAAYLGLPPAWNNQTGELDYKVASPHLDENSQLSIGSYTVSLPSIAAKCLYGSSTLPSRVEMSVGTDEGVLDITRTIELSDVNGWLNFSIKGFHFSSPTIKLKLGRVASSTSTVSPSTTVPPVLTPTVTVTVPTATIPVAITTVSSTTLTVRANKTATAKSIAAFAKLTVAKTSKVSLKVAASSAKYCKVSGTSLKGVKAGTCKVTVTVTLKSGKKSAKVVTLKIAK